ncbi:hypothetical protein D3C81_836480 [compost metagenome]
MRVSAGGQAPQAIQHAAYRAQVHQRQLTQQLQRGVGLHHVGAVDLQTAAFDIAIATEDGAERRIHQLIHRAHQAAVADDQPGRPGRNRRRGCVRRDRVAGQSAHHIRQTTGQSTNHATERIGHAGHARTGAGDASQRAAGSAQQRGCGVVHRAQQILHRAGDITIGQRAGGVFQPAGQRVHRIGKPVTQRA